MGGGLEWLRIRGARNSIDKLMGVCQDGERVDP